MGHPISTQDKYKLSKSINTMDHLTEIPCGVCPLINRCCEGGDVSPSNCEYYAKWLESIEDAPVDMSW